MGFMKRGYTNTAITLHWLIALLIISIFSIGLHMVNLPVSPHKLKIYSYHKWTGMTVLALMILRLSWRVTHPPLPYDLKQWKQLSGAVHVSLYIFAVAIPVSGWLMSSAAGYRVVYLGVLPIPDLIGKDKELAEFLKWLHKSMNVTLMVLFIVHISGVFKHLLIDRETTILARMIPLLKRKNP